MVKPSSSRPPQKSTTGRRVRLIPSTPQPEGTATPAAQPVHILNLGTQKPPETFGGNLYSNIIREGMARLNREEMGVEEEEKNSSESSSEGTNPAEAQTSATSSSLLRFSDGRTFGEIADEVIREIHEAEGRSEEQQENPVREILDLTGTDDEGVALADDWRTQIANTVNQLVVDNAEQNVMLKAQGEQMTKLVNLVDRVITWMDRETKSSNQPSPEFSATGPSAPQQAVPDTNLAETSRKRTRHSGSQGSQGKD